MKILEKSDDMFAEELNVKNLLEKIRSTYDIQKEFIKQNQLFLKYNKTRVIDICSEESSSGSDDPIIEP